ncbi:phospholipase D-like domain-containing protein [Myxococcota bacterium]|nr:phospholipase D-like domain-containing protein [Myxococcota bacterium]
MISSLRPSHRARRALVRRAAPVAASLALLTACATAPAPPVPRTLGAIDPAPRAIELVQTVPVETTLGAQGLRTPAEVWPELVRAAERSIELASFYAATKEPSALSATMTALREAGARGVAIRVLVDSKLAKTYAASIDELRAIPGAVVRVLDFAPLSATGIQHAKYLVVDERRVFVGSPNFDWRALEHIHETGLVLDSAPIAAKLRAIFEHDFAAAEVIAAARSLGCDHGPVATATSSAKVELVASPAEHLPPGIRHSEAALVALIGEAREALAIEVLDYCPLEYSKQRYYPPIDVALRSAAARGVAVKLLVSHWNLAAPCVEHLKSLSLVPNVEVKVATIPDASAGPIPFARVIHAKYIVADGAIAWIGTSNFGGGYLDRSRNVELVVRDRAIAAALLAIHAELWASPYAAPIDVTRAYARPPR